MNPQHTNGRLVAGVRDGDVEALGRLYERHKALVYRTALAITRDEAAAEDILQEVFLRVYVYAHRFDETAPLEPWLYRVTVNQAYSWVSRAKRLFRAVQGALDRLKSSAQWQSGPEKAAEEREQWQHLQKAIDALSPVQQIVVVLHYLEGLSLQEIAEVLDIPQGTVKSRLHYARRKLREAMQEQERRLVPEVAYDFT